MISNKNYKRICVVDYLPLNVRLDLEDDFRKEVFSKAIDKCGTKAMDLASKLGFSKDYVNKCRRGYTRPTLDSIQKILNFLNMDIISFWNKVVSIGKAGSKEFITLPYLIQFDENLAWFFGFRDGDGIRENVVGACAAPKEIGLILKYKKIFDSFVITSNKWSVYIKSRIISITQVRGMFPDCRVYQYIHGIKDHHEGIINLQIGSRVLNKFFYNIEQDLEKILLKSPDEVKFAYLRGFFDTDGCVDIHGSLVLRQCEKAYFRIYRVEKILESVSIKFRTFKRKDGFSLVIYDLIDYKNKIGFESDIKCNQLNKIISFSKVLRDDSNITSMILKITNNPITKKELMFELCVKYGKMSNAIRGLVKSEQLKIVKQRPLTVVNCSDV